MHEKRCIDWGTGVAEELNVDNNVQKRVFNVFFVDITHVLFGIIILLSSEMRL